MKSGYHHVDICPDLQKFLGFQWPLNSTKIDLSKFQYYQQCLTEVKFWSNNIVSLNNRNLLGHHAPTAIFYSDASAYACGGHVFFIDRTEFDVYFTAFSCREIELDSKSRELLGILYGLRAFKRHLKNI